MTTRTVGIALIVAAYALLFYFSLASHFFRPGPHSHLDPGMLVQYGAPWPVALAGSLAIAGILLALVPVRRGERWAWWTLLATWAVLLVTRLATDPRCLLVLDPHQHGCHTFMIAVVVGVAGLALAWRRTKSGL